MRQKRKKNVAVPERLRLLAEKETEEQELRLEPGNGSIRMARETAVHGISLTGYRPLYPNGAVQRKSKKEFFRCMAGWFQTVQTLSESYVTMLLEEERPVSAMWSCYSQNPVLDCSSGRGIEEILKDMLFYRRICLAA